MAKALVTGGAGFIGSHLVDRLVNNGHAVIVLDNLSAGNIGNVNAAAKLHKLDISADEMSSHFQDVDVVFHLAAINRIQRSINNPVMTNAHNVGGTLNVLEAAKRAGVKKVIYSSSSSVYGGIGSTQEATTEKSSCLPQSPYALQKYVGEQYCRVYSDLYGLDTVVLRYFNVYGPRQQSTGSDPAVVSKFILQRVSGQPLSVAGDGEMRRDFTYVADVVEANMRSWEKEVSGGEVFNVGTGQNRSITELAQLISDTVVSTPRREGDRDFSLADNKKARDILGWSPTVSLEQGISMLLKEQEAIKGSAKTPSA